MKLKKKRTSFYIQKKQNKKVHLIKRYSNPNQLISQSINISISIYDSYTSIFH
jgi:hypothetical protein